MATKVMQEDLLRGIWLLLVADSTVPLSVKIDGPAELAAFGAAKALHRKGYELPDTTTGEGHALAILKLTGKEGRISVTISNYFGRNQLR